MSQYLKGGHGEDMEGAASPDSILFTIASGLQDYNRGEHLPSGFAALRSELPSSLTEDEAGLLLKKSDQLPAQLKKSYLFLLFHYADRVPDSLRLPYLRSRSENPLSLLRSTAEHFADYRKTPILLPQCVEQIASAFHALYSQDPSDATLRKFSFILRWCFFQMKLSTMEKLSGGASGIQNKFFNNFFRAIKSRMSAAEVSHIESKIRSHLTSDPSPGDSSFFESFLDETAPFKTDQTGKPQFDSHNRLVIRNPRAAFLHGLPIYCTKIIEGAPSEDANFIQATHLVHSIQNGVLSATDVRALVVACSFPHDNDRILRELDGFLVFFASRDFRSLLSPLVLSLEYLGAPADGYLETFLRDRVFPQKSASYFQAILDETLFVDPSALLLAPKSLRFLAQHGLLPDPAFLVRSGETLPSTQAFVWKRAFALSDAHVDESLELFRQPLLHGTLEPQDFERGLKDFVFILEGVLSAERLEIFLGDIRLQYGNARSTHEAELRQAREAARQQRAARRTGGRSGNGTTSSEEVSPPSATSLTVQQVNERFFSTTDALRTSIGGIEENAIRLRGYRDRVKSELKALLPYNEPFSVSSGADSLLARLGIANVDFTPNDADYHVTLHFDDGQSFDGIRLSGVSGAEASVNFPEHFPKWVTILLECELSRVFYEHLVRHVLQIEIPPDEDYRLLFLSALGFPVHVEDDVLGTCASCPSGLPVPPPVMPADEAADSVPEVAEVPFLDRNYELFERVTSLKGIHFPHSFDVLNRDIAGLRSALSRRGITSLLPGGGSLIQTAESPLKFLVPNIRMFHPEESRRLLEEYTGWKPRELPQDLIDCHVCIADITFPDSDDVQQLVFYISPASHDRDREVNLVGLQGCDLSEDLSESRLRIFRELELLLLRAFHQAVCREEYSGRRGVGGRHVEIDLPADPSDPSNGVHQEAPPQVIIQRGLESDEAPLDDAAGDIRRGIDHVYRMSPERVFEALLFSEGDDAAEKLYKKGGVAVPMDIHILLHQIAPDIFHNIPNLTRGMNFRRMLEPVYSRDGVKKIHELVFSKAMRYVESWFSSGYTLDRLFAGLWQGAIVPSSDIPRSILACKGPLNQLTFPEDQTVRALLTLPCLNPYTVYIGPRKDVVTLYRLSPYKPRDDARFRDATLLDSRNLGGQFRVISNGAARLSDHSLIATRQRSDSMTLVAQERNALMHQNPLLHGEDLLDLGPRAQAIIVFERDQSPNDTLNTLRCFVHLSSARASIDPHEGGNVTSSAPQNLARNSYFRAEVARCRKENQSGGVFEGFDHAVDHTNPRFSKANIDRMREAGFWEWDRNCYDGHGGVRVDRSYILVFDGADIGVRQGLDNPKYAEFCEWCLRENVSSDWTPELQNFDHDLLPIQRYLFENVIGRHVLSPPRS